MAIGKVTLVRLAAVTHWFDHNQRLLSLEFVVFVTEEGDMTLRVTPPVDSNLAPPGQYMLFAVSLVEGVPSIARYVTLRQEPGTGPIACTTGCFTGATIRAAGQTRGRSAAELG